MSIFFSFFFFFEKNNKKRFVVVEHRTDIDPLTDFDDLIAIYYNRFLEDATLPYTLIILICATNDMTQQWIFVIRAFVLKQLHCL